MSKKTEIKAAGRSTVMSIDKFIEKDYHTRVPLFPETIDEEKTNDFIAWKLGRLPVKACFFLNIIWLKCTCTHSLMSLLLVVNVIICRKNALIRH